MQSAAQAYGAVAKQTARPRELEANLLLRAAARLQTIMDSWETKQRELDDALLYNRRLWTIFVTSATGSESQLPVAMRQNIANLGLFVINQTMSASFERRPEKLRSLITINREVAAGLLAQ
jgi:flagellar protein FlaF